MANIPSAASSCSACGHVFRLRSVNPTSVVKRPRPPKPRSASPGAPRPRGRPRKPTDPPGPGPAQGPAMQLAAVALGVPVAAPVPGIPGVAAGPVQSVAPPPVPVQGPVLPSAEDALRARGRKGDGVVLPPPVPDALQGMMAFPDVHSAAQVLTEGLGKSYFGEDHADRH